MRPIHKSGFTAIEMLGVLALMAILAAAALLSLTKLQTNSDMDGVIDRVKYFDQLTRQQSLRSGQSLKLTFDRNTIGRQKTIAGSAEQSLAKLQLPDGFVIDRAMIAASSQSEAVISANGFSPTYAILLDRQGERRWIMVSTVGQVRQVNDDGTIEFEMERLRHPEAGNDAG